jgi:hypothetical protein
MSSSRWRDVGTGDPRFFVDYLDKAAAASASTQAPR